MGFHLNGQARWIWVLDNFFQKLKKWRGYQSTLPSRLFVLNHCILPSLIYYLVCWKPTKSHLSSVPSLANQFLWGGDEEHKRMSKVAYNICVLPKEKGGSGLLDGTNLA